MTTFIYLNHPLSYYVQRIKDRDYFSFARYGDGEWHAILGDPGENCDGHEYYPDMGKALEKTLYMPFIKATIPAVAREIGQERIDDYLSKAGFRTFTWHDGNVFRDAVLNGTFGSLVKVLRKKKVHYVGPRFLMKFCLEQVGADSFTVIPPKDCYLAYSSILRRVRGMMETYKPEIVGFSASMMTELLIADLYEEFGTVLTMIDFGSVFDPFPANGYPSRNYMKSMNVQQALRKNFLEVSR